jgi:hypothetical protein
MLTHNLNEIPANHQVPLHYLLSLFESSIPISYGIKNYDINYAVSSDPRRAVD